MTENLTADVATLRDRIVDLDPADRRAIVAALETERDNAPGNVVADRWAAYCADHPHDPLCGSVGRYEPDYGYLERLPAGGGCAEAWEYLSAYRDARRPDRR